MIPGVSLPDCFASGDILSSSGAAENGCFGCDHFSDCLRVSKEEADR